MVMKKEIENLCRYADYRTQPRGEYCICLAEGRTEVDLECRANHWYPRGHNWDNSYIDLDDMNACPNRVGKK